MLKNKTGSLVTEENFLIIIKIYKANLSSLFIAFRDKILQNSKPKRYCETFH